MPARYARLRCLLDRILSEHFDVNSCLESSMDRGVWQATVHGVAKSWTQLSD